MSKSLVKMADAYMGDLRQNPAKSVDERVDGFCVSIKEHGEPLSQWSEIDWILALERLGVEDGNLASTMESVASWGVDD
jgi:hypothetical protein